MIQLQVKFGREVVWIDESDVVLDNGAVVQILTKQKAVGWDSSPVKIARYLFKQYKSCGFFIEKKSNNFGTYYRFDIDAMKKFANTEDGYPMREVD